MKRTRSPSPENGNNGDTLALAVKKPKSISIKSLAEVELHPFLSKTTDLKQSTTLVKSEEQLIKENPFLAHWQQQKPNNKKQQRIPHVDKNLATEPSAHRPRPLKFNAPGKFVAKAEAERAAAHIRQLEREIAEATENLGNDLDVNLVADILRSEQTGDEEMEWWDVPFLRQEAAAATTTRTPSSSSSSLYFSSFSLAFDILGNLIQRPSLTSAQTKNGNSEALKIYLTPEERKKLRRQRRLEAQKEVQEKIALGLLPPPPAKVKLSSLPRMLAQAGNALGDESVQDPTRIAAEIRAQSVARQEAHQQSNAERKLTEDERAAKKFRKFAELDAEEIQVAVFKLKDRLEDGAKRFKVLINAEQNHLYGRSVTTPNFTLIIVEGGPKGIKRYTRLLLERIEPSDPTWATLLWNGSQAAKSTKLTEEGAGKPFQMKIFEMNFEAQEYLDKWGYSHFWPLVIKE